MNNLLYKFSIPFTELGTYNVQAMAFLENDTVMLGAPAIVKIVRAQPKLHLLSVGPFHPDLHYNDNDATDFASLFRNQNSLYADINIKTLTGKNAIRDSIVYHLTTMQDRFGIRKQDLLVLFFSSHGELDDGDAYILPYKYNPASVVFSAIQVRDVLKMAKKYKCKTLLFLDACQVGGGKNMGDEVVDQPKEEGLEVVPIVGSAIDQIVNAENEISIFTSSGAEPSWEDDQWGNGSFTEALVEGLQGAADGADGKYKKDNLIYLDELYGYIHKRCPELNAEIKKPAQRPKFSNKIGKMPFYKVE